MSSKMPLRQFLMFRELINRSPDPATRVDALLDTHADWDPEEKRSWEAWKEADLPQPGARRTVETVETNDLL